MRKSKIDNVVESEAFNKSVNDEIDIKDAQQMYEEKYTLASRVFDKFNEICDVDGKGVELYAQLLGKVSKLCFQDLKNEDSRAQHIMYRVIAGSAIDKNNQSDAGALFIYDQRDALIEQWLKELVKIQDKETIKKLSERLDDKLEVTRH